MSGKARAALVVVAAALSLLAACGLPTDSAPRVIAEEKLQGLRESTTTNPDSVGVYQVSLFFVKGDRLVLRKRGLSDNSAQTVLEALISGPRETETDLTGAIPNGTKLLRTDQNDGTMTVVLTKDILSVTGPLQKTAFAQLVYTATELPNVNDVRFMVADADGSNQQEVAPPTDSGAKKDTLTKSDYDSLKP
jgi:hypothetical protein